MAKKPVTAQQRRELRLERRQRGAMYAPLMLAILVATQAAATALTGTVNEPLYEIFLRSLMLLGVVLSFLGVIYKRNFNFFGIILMLFAFVGYAVRRSVEITPTILLYPYEISGDDETFLAALAAWCLVGFCFMQSQRDNLVFVFVPGITIFGLMATRNPNMGLFISFLFFLLASVFAWGYEHFLRAVGDRQVALHWGEWAKHHFSTAVFLFVIVGAGGALIGTALDYTTPQMYAGTGLQRRVWNWAGSQNQGYFAFRPNFDLIGGQVRLSPDPILKIKAPQATLMRGRAYDYYSGEGWRRSFEGVVRTKRIDTHTYNVQEFDPILRPHDETGMMYGMTPGMMGGGNMPGPNQQMNPGMPPQGNASPQKTHIDSNAVRPVQPPSGMSIEQMQKYMQTQMQKLAQQSTQQNQTPSSKNMPGIPQQNSWDNQRWQADTQGLPDNFIFPPLQGQEFQQEIEVLTTSTTGIFSAPFAYKVKLGSNVGVIDFSRSIGISSDFLGSLTVGSVMQPGQKYTVWSRLPEFSPEDLRTSPQQYTDDIRRSYIEQNSLVVVDELKPLVEEIIADCTNPYDKVNALQLWLEEHCIYTLDVPITPRNKDAVVNFVMHTRRGACDLFASALALMCRIADIPARVAVGFAPGTYDKAEDAIIVRGTEAHAWTEVYFRGHGWVSFDPAAQRRDDAPNLIELLKIGQWRFVLNRASSYALYIILICLGLYVSATALIDPRPYFMAVLSKFRPRPLFVQVITEYEALLRRILHKAKKRWNQSHTPLEILELQAVQSVSEKKPGLHQELVKLTRLFYVVRYGKKASIEQINELRQKIRLIQRRLREHNYTTQ